MKQWMVLMIVSALFSLGACANGTPTGGTAASPSAPPSPASPVSGDKVSFQTAQTIITQRCLPCHSSTPSIQGFGSPAGNTSLDTPEAIKKVASRIKARAVSSTGMPFGNRTNITDDERKTLGRWVDQGASLN